MASNTVFEGLAHPTRRAVLGLLRRRGELSAGEIAEELAVAKPTLSGHLNVLKSAELVLTERVGTSIRYRPNMTVLQETTQALLDLIGAGAAHEKGADDTHPRK